MQKNIHEAAHCDRPDLHQLSKPEPTPVAATPVGASLLVVIDQRTARIYSTNMLGSVPQLLIPYDRSGSGLHLHTVEDHPIGRRGTGQQRFYAAVARTLRDAETILVFGCGTEAAKVMDRLLVELHEHHQDVARRIVRTVVMAEQQLSEDELVAKARKLYADLDAL